MAQAAGKYGEHAPMATVCCNACRTCWTTNIIGLFVAGALDLLAPPAAVRGGYELWAGEKELWIAGREAGLSTDYGHSDLIFGRKAPEEVYPRVVTWLRAHSEPALPVPPPA